MSQFCCVKENIKMMNKTLDSIRNAQVNCYFFCFCCHVPPHSFSYPMLVTLILFNFLIQKWSEILQLWKHDPNLFFIVRYYEANKRFAQRYWKQKYCSTYRVIFWNTQYNWENYGYVYFFKGGTIYEPMVRRTQVNYKGVSQ